MFRNYCSDLTAGGGLCYAVVILFVILVLLASFVVEDPSEVSANNDRAMPLLSGEHASTSLNEKVF